MLIKCTVCGRTHGQRESGESGVSSELCAKCYSAVYGENMDDLREIFKREYVAKEESGNVVWNGPERQYTDSELEAYNKVLSEVRRERGEGINNGTDRK